MTGVFRFCVPSKGSLHQGTLDLLERCLIPIERGAGARSYSARMKGVPGVEVVLAPANDITRLVRSGQAHAGITGFDLFREATEGTQGGVKARLVIHDLGYGNARLVVGVPRSWIDVTTLQDLQEVAADFRHAHGRTLRVATKFPSLARAHFREHGLTSYRIVESLGATEGSPRVGTADLVVDLTSTGATFESNALKEIDGGLIVASQACLIASGDRAVWAGEYRQVLEHLVEMIAAGLSAQSTRMIRAKLPATLSAEQVKQLEEMLLDTEWLPRSVSDWGSATPEVDIVRLRGLVAIDGLHPLLRLLRTLDCTNFVVEAPVLVLERVDNHAVRFFLKLDRQDRVASATDHDSADSVRSTP